MLFVLPLAVCVLLLIHRRARSQLGRATPRGVVVFRPLTTSEALLFRRLMVVASTMVFGGVSLMVADSAAGFGAGLGGSLVIGGCGIHMGLVLGRLRQRVFLTAEADTKEGGGRSRPEAVSQPGATLTEDDIGAAADGLVSETEAFLAEAARRPPDGASA